METMESGQQHNYAAASSASATATTTATQQLRQLLTVPPPSMPDHQRGNPVAVAHAALQQLRDSGDVNWLFLRTLLELVVSRSSAQDQQHPPAGDEEELLFHCITGCRQVVLLHKWPPLSSSGRHYEYAFLDRLRDYFMVLGHALSVRQQHRTCRLACYTAAVAFWKRGWNDNDDNQDHQAASASANMTTTMGPQEQTLFAGMAASLPPQTLLVSLHSKHDLFRYLETELFPQNLHCGALFLKILVSELGAKSSVDYRLPLEFHKQAHQKFEKELGLLQSLQLSMTALGHVLPSITTTSSAPAATPVPIDPNLLDSAIAVVQLTTDVLGWPFGMATWDTGAIGAAAALSWSSRTVICPPSSWGPLLLQPNLVSALFHTHNALLLQQQQESQSTMVLAQGLRQLILQLAGLSGPIFPPDTSDRQQYATILCEGTLQLLQTASPASNAAIAASAADFRRRSGLLLDTLQLLSRLIANFRLHVLMQVPTFTSLLQGLTSVGQTLLADHLCECEAVHGDVDSMAHYEEREEILQLVLECAVLLCEDPYFLRGTSQSIAGAQESLSRVLGPLYEGFVHCRTRMAAMEEHHMVTHEAECDEVREAIMEVGLQEEMELAAAIGRLHLSAALACLSSAFGTTMPRLQALWDTNGHVTAETSALLEEARLLVLYVCHLLTDNNEGESPSIPDAIMAACRVQEALAGQLSGALQAVLTFADNQAQKIAKDPTNQRLSPLLAKTFLWFLIRWAPAYVHPEHHGASDATNRLVQEWTNQEHAAQAINFCLSLCLTYQCYWPQEPTVQESCGRLLLSLAKRGGSVRSLMVASKVFHDMVLFHCLTSGNRHTASREELGTAFLAKAGNGIAAPIDKILGYQRLPYRDKARVLSAILVSCSDPKDERANAMLAESLKAVHDAFDRLMRGLAGIKHVNSDDVNSREHACLCVELFCAIANASEMSKPERIPQFVTTYLPKLSGLMISYARDLTVCETLLRLFRDYTANFITLLNTDQSVVLFQASAELLRSYSTQHCSSRVVVKSATEANAEEEQAYGDVLCAIQLLINLGTKDFIDTCSAQKGAESTEATDVIFYGLQQILPLMTQGLLQFPTLCAQFFDLVGFMMDTYPDKVCVLPIELFESLLESLLFGMSHQDTNVSKCSLFGVASIVREHLKTGVLKPHLEQRPEILDRCSRRLLSEVVFQTVVVDRVEAAGMALLPLAAVDVNRFASVVQQLSMRVPEQQRGRLEQAFSRLLQPEVLHKVTLEGYEGRTNRIRFKKDFELFVQEIQSFLVLL